MSPFLDDLTAHLLARLAEVQQHLGCAPDAPADADARFADQVDSMGMVELVALLAEDCGVRPEAVERCAGQRFGTVAELARSMLAAGLVPRAGSVAVAEPVRSAPLSPTCWLAATAVRLPEAVQAAAALNEALGRPPGWLEAHAGIESRRVWREQDPLASAAEAGRECLERAGLLPEEVGALLVTSEAPPLLAGLAAALHHRLGLRPETAAVEVGGACTGFLTAVWLGQRLLAGAGAVLVVAVEAPSRWLHVEPGPAGEAAALFGDAAAAALLCAQPAGEESVAVGEVLLGVDGGAGHLLQVCRSESGQVELHMDGGALASRALRAMADAVREAAHCGGLEVADLAAVVAHGGNGRMPALLARQLGLPPERLWSETARTGNLGAASLPVAWAAHPARPRGPVAWTAVGAGLTWAAAMVGRKER